MFLLHCEVGDCNCFLFVSFMRNLQLLKVEWLATGKWILFSFKMKSEVPFILRLSLFMYRPTYFTSKWSGICKGFFEDQVSKALRKSKASIVVTEMLLLRYSWKNALNKQIFKRSMSKKQAFQPCVYCYPQALGWFLIVCNVSNPGL